MRPVFQSQLPVIEGQVVTETDERMMVRLLAFALHAYEALLFGGLVRGRVLGDGERYSETATLQELPRCRLLHDSRGGKKRPSHGDSD